MCRTAEYFLLAVLCIVAAGCEANTDRAANANNEAAAAVAGESSVDRSIQFTDDSGETVGTTTISDDGQVTHE